MAQAFINVVIPFEPEHSDAVNEVLRQLARPGQGNRPLAAIEERLDKAGFLHFMSITVVEPKCPAEDVAPPQKKSFFSGRPKSHLLIEISADRGTAEVLTALADDNLLKCQLNDVLAAANVMRGGEALAAYLLRHVRVIGASWGYTLGQIFSGSPGQSARRIRCEADLAARIGALIHRERLTPNWIVLSPRQRLDHIRDLLWHQGDTKWAFAPEAAICLAGSPDSTVSITNPQIWKVAGSILTNLLWPLFAVVLVVYVFNWSYQESLVVQKWPPWHSWDLIGLLRRALACLPPFCIALKPTLWLVKWLFAALLVGFVVAYLWLRYLENTDRSDDRTPPSKQVEALMRVETFCVQNHMATVSRLKPGLLRRLTLRIAFIVVGTGRFVCAPGFLGINGVIHFARWMRLPGTDQLLFCSNYDGTWQAYVADFIADAPTGVTGIWSNCVGFPPTSALFGDGAEDRDRLVRWARRQQHPTFFWYSAYRDLTAARIRTNAAIRQGIASAESDQDARDWLTLFGSRPVPPTVLQTSQIPTLVFGGLSNLPYMACHAIEFGGDPAQCRQWLATVADLVNYGEVRPYETSAVVVALSKTGLEKLGLPQEALETFPVAFQQGMWPEWRARALGDVGCNAPEKWEWGNEKDPVDALLLVYGQAQIDIVRARSRALPAGQFGLRERKPVLARALASKTGLKEKFPSVKPRLVFPKVPFGFADGISQPVIRGTPRSNARENQYHVVDAGEMVLGYPDNTGQLPPSPSIADEHDPEHCLPDAGPDPFRTRPEFSCYEGQGQRDLGANGTFLVVRKLQQNVEHFNEWLDKVSAQVPANWPNSPVPPTREVIAAKLVGRWQNGDSLVRHPVAPGATASGDNDFLLGAEDPSGLKCPFGAHIRRANPRDTRFPGSLDEVATINRHRILRVGRVYVNTAADEPPPQALAPEEPGDGLLFMCVNADIERQFEFIQKTWLLNPNIQGLADEVDTVMGIDSRFLTIPTPDGPVRIEVKEQLADFVTTKAGGYFFLPGRNALRFLATAKFPPSLP